jgi:hypothetical protein
MQHQTSKQTGIAAEAATHASAILHQALIMTARGTIRAVFDQAVTREVSYMLERGARPTAIAAFKNAAADVHQALGPDSSPTVRHRVARVRAWSQPERGVRARRHRRSLPA